MYADDTVLFADSKAGLQNILTSYEQYCQINKLNINSSKTKVVKFGKNTAKQKFYINGDEIEMVNNFKYLGVTITNKGKYKLTIKDNIEKARKAFYAQLRQVRQNYIPLDCHIDLFIKTIEPILLYGAEIWGYENHKHLEQFLLRCLKTILNVKTSTPDYMVYGELGIYPLEETIKLRMINYWGNLITGKQSKISAILYNTSRQNTFSIQPVFKWNEAIKKILDELGFSLLWSTKTPELLYPFKATEIKQRLSDQSQQKY